jgi:hypothetical protein
MKQNQALYLEDGQEPAGPDGSINKKSNNPQAEVWGIGKSKL